MEYIICVYLHTYTYTSICVNIFIYMYTNVLFIAEEDVETLYLIIINDRSKT